MSWLSALGSGALGAAGGFLIGGPIGAMAGFGIGLGSAAAGMSGSQSNTGKWGGAITGGLVGFAIGGPFGALAGGALGALFGNAVQGAHQQQPQMPPYANQFPGGGFGGYGMPGGMPFGYGMPGGGFPMGGFGFPPSGFGMPNMGGFGFMGFAGCFPPPQGGGCCQPPCNQPPVCGGGQLTQEGPGKPAVYTTSGGYKVQMDGTTVRITDPSGKHSVEHWGDPHENVNGKHLKDWEGKTRSIVLEDGTRITMNATAANGLITDTSIYDGAQEIKYNNTDKTITSVGFNPYQTAYNAQNQAAGETAYFGHDEKGDLVYRNMFKQNEDLSITPHTRDIAVLERAHDCHRPQQNWWMFGAVAA